MAGNTKSGAGSPGRSGGRGSVAVMSASLVRRRGLAEERQHHKRVGLEPGPLAHLLRLRQIDLGLRLVPGIEIERGETVVAWKQELRLSGALGQVQRLAIRAEGQGVIAGALIDLAQHDTAPLQV